MKPKQLCFVRIGLAIILGGSLVAWNGIEEPANAEVNLSVSLDIRSPADFYSPLSPHGRWVDVGRYGRCWRPGEVEVGWRPYTIGHWEWTDCGWYWASDEPWAWACYHYGNWVLDPADGWVWVPGTEWAPAWVVWREAPDYIGWAPCGPGGRAFSDTSFVFVDMHHFHDRLEPRELVFNDPGVFRRSHGIGGFRSETRDFDGMRRHIAINQGPALDPIQRATGTRFTPRPVTELVRQTPVPQSMTRNLAQQPSAERPRATQETDRSRTGREQQRLYREAPSAQPAPTGRSEQRLYREVPSTQTAPQPRQSPPQPVPRRQPVPQVSQPPAAAPERRLPPTGRESGRTEPQVPRRGEQSSPRAEQPAPRVEQPAPRVAPAPSQRQTPAPAPRSPQEREKQRGDGQ